MPPTLPQSCICPSEQIRNTISLIALSFDTNNFSQLQDSFTPDASTDYVGSLGLLKGISAITTGLRQAIGHISTFHALSTQKIELTGEGNSAEATTYCSASHFLGDKSFFAEARYVDRLVKVMVHGEEKWLIAERVVTMMGVPRGDVGIFGLELNGWAESLKVI